MSQEICDRFLSFEEEQGMFNLRDSKGRPVWDILRYHIYSNLIYGDYKKKSHQVSRDYIYKCKVLFKWLKSLFIRSKYLFYLASRNKKNDGKLFDKNADDVLKCLSGHDCIIIESFSRVDSSDLSYDMGFLLANFPFSLLYRIYPAPSFDFTGIYRTVKAQFPSLSISIIELRRIYIRFYAQRAFYKFFLKRWKIRKVFLVQNDIQKGLIAACKELGIAIYEFQHGIVEHGHMAYSYSPRTKPSDVYLPDTIFSLSKFWFKDLTMPGVHVLPIGNNNFWIMPVSKEAGSGKNILVISADVYGEELSSFVKECVKDSFFNSYTFYFKLHPNQFGEKGWYIDYFRECANVEVITDEWDVPTLVRKSETILAIVSTAVYEGLQGNSRVCILKRDNYLAHKCLFNHPNVFLIDSRDDFKKSILGPLKSNDEVFFSSFNMDLFKQSLSKNKC